MKADPAAQLRLLDLQGTDARADQLRHRRDHLPELHEIAVLEEQRRSADDRRRDAQVVVDDLSVEQAKADKDVEQVRIRRERDQQRMDSGAVSNPKDLQRMQDELASLERRISVLEDEELEVMERLEEAQTTLTSVTEEVAAADEKLVELRATRDEKYAELDAELTGVLAERDPSGVPDDLLALYEKLRASKGGVGAAELRARACGGCRLTLDNAELAQIRNAPTDQVVRCEECQRILVRTPESGL
ncbi:MAG: hypothetical protein CMH83_00295 [Nocardioides sp.]|nr:hypothetical protein [Nocardioides sp.]